MKCSLIIAAAVYPFVLNALVSPNIPNKNIYSNELQKTKPSEVSIIGTPQYGGSGCPDGTARMIVTPDGQSFTVIMDQFIVTAGPKWFNNPPAPTKDRLFCQINVFLQLPPGYQCTIVQSSYRGYLDIEKGVKATFATELYFTGQARGIHFQYHKMGPVTAGYTMSQPVRDNPATIDSNVWSTCGVYANLNIKTDMRIDTSKGARDANGQLIANGKAAVDSRDGGVVLAYGIRLRKCAPPTSDDDDDAYKTSNDDDDAYKTSNDDDE